MPNNPGQTASSIMNWIAERYNQLVLGRPLLVLILLVCLFAFFAYHARDFRLDASSDSLLLENDQDLKVYREVIDRYETKSFLVLTFTPTEDLFSDNTLARITNLKKDLEDLPGVESVFSLVDVPLVKNVEGRLTDLEANLRMLSQDGVDKDRAREELLNSPLFRELIISADGGTTALRVELGAESEFEALRKQRDQLFEKRRAAPLSAEEQAALSAVLQQYDAAKKRRDDLRHQTIVSVRDIMNRYRSDAELHLGGVPMIADDMITYIKSDLVVFGVGVFVLLVAMLGIIFRRARWVLLPLASCVFSALLMIGVLGLAGWRVTVISSNFVSLMLIITMSMNIHLVVRYRQLREDLPDCTQRELVLMTARKMVWPCFYTALTTIMAFASLVVSDIKPVIDFGWMMTIGLTVTFLTTFLLFPSILVLLNKTPAEPETGRQLRFASALARLTERHGNAVLVISIALAVLSVIGISRLKVENSFISYFSEDTEIHQGLKLIDEKLGGTIPMDVIVRFHDPDFMDEEDDELLELYPELKTNVADYWFTPDKINRIKQVHDYLDALPAVGKVLSLAAVIRVAEDLEGGREFDSFQMAIMYKRMPDEFKQSLIAPYVSFENNEARISLRILDSMEDLRRNELLETIRTDLTEKLGFAEGDTRLTGGLVLYNNMLQSLFKSQILTLGVVMLGIAFMLLILFRSLPLAIIGIVPNLLAAGIVLGFMGLAGIPLDMMTITIAAITIGIAVDNSIHYIYRFREELAQRKDYLATMHYCHANIGKAVFYTAITIILGFSILALSNFIPTIYFGVLTALAMFIALLASLTLLPRLLLLWRPIRTD
ncbi:MAG TPA: MMPL family transporter, partial [Burkholderiales bacterium]|nr:MMPL family transporter [Burkholderiales bacterium]